MANNCSYEAALLAYGEGKFALAKSAATEALQPDFSCPDALHVLALVLIGEGAFSSASVVMEKAISVRATAQHMNTLCVAQIERGVYRAALSTALAGLRLLQSQESACDPTKLLFNLGLVYQNLEEFDSAICAYSRVLDIAPGHSSAENNLGICFARLERSDEALECFYRATAASGLNTHAMCNLGNALLAAGRYEEAWPYFEFRWAGLPRLEQASYLNVYNMPVKKWAGQSSDACGGTLLVWAEQGYGDTLQFCRFLPDVLGIFDVVGFVCPPTLNRLIESSFLERWPNLQLLDALPESLSAWDWQCSLLSIAGALGVKVCSIPAEPYLRPSRSARKKWGGKFRRLPADGRLRVGLVWAGGHSETSVDRHRSIPVELLSPLLDWRDVNWFSLQIADSAGKVLPVSRYPHVIDWMPDVMDFDDTAAIIDCLDLVITVDTALAHLAGAMGKDVWLLNRFAGCWRWMRDRQDSPWYRGIYIFRQAIDRDWASVLLGVRKKLEALSIARRVIVSESEVADVPRLSDSWH